VSTPRWQAADPWAGWRLHATAAFDQRAFRFRNDDGGEATATWKAVQNGNISQMTGEVFRLRIEVQETGGGAANNQTIVLQSNINGGGWFDVGPTSNGVRLGNSQHVGNGTPTTNQLTAGTGAFVPGVLLTSTSGTNISFAGLDHTEVEWASLLISEDVPGGSTVQFRVTVNGAVPAISATPVITAIAAPPAKTGGGEATVVVSAEGGGSASIPESATGGGEAAVTVSAEGGGRKGATGGSEAAVTVSAEGGGSGSVPKHAVGGGEAVVLVSADGGGSASIPKHATGGGEVTGLVVSAEGGSGIKSATGGADAGISLEADGGGTKSTTSGGEASVTIHATGGGSSVVTPDRTGGGEAVVAVDADGGGSRATSGGADAVVTTGADGGGHRGAVGGSDALVAVWALGGGSRATTGGGEAVVLVTATGGGGSVLVWRDISIAPAGPSKRVLTSAASSATYTVTLSGSRTSTSEPYLSVEPLGFATTGETLSATMSMVTLETDGPRTSLFASEPKL
jgi:hypothetical protein